MPLIGITGGVACGKSTVTAALAGLGAQTFSADDAARVTAAPGSAVVDEVRRVFGGGVVADDGAIDRAALGEIVFGDDGARRELERITHPPILRLLRAWLEGALVDLGPRRVTAAEVPLLFETGLEGWFDAVVTVTAERSVQVRRLAERNNLGEKAAAQRVAVGLPLEEKARKADYVLRNDGRIEALRAAVSELWPRLEASTRRGRLQP